MVDRQPTIVKLLLRCKYSVVLGRVVYQLNGFGYLWVVFVFILHLAVGILVAAHYFVF